MAVCEAGAGRICAFDGGAHGVRAAAASRACGGAVVPVEGPSFGPGRTGSAARQTTGRRAPAARKTASPRTRAATAGDQPRRRNRRQEGARLHDLWPRSEDGNRPGGRHARHERERTPGFRIGAMFLAPPGPGFPGFPAGVPQQQRKITAPPRGCLKGAGHRLWPARPRFTSCVTSRRACFCCCGYRHPPAVGIAVARPPQ